AQSVVHPLLDNAPTTLGGEKETMMIKRVAVLNGSGVHFGAHPRCIDEFASVCNRSLGSGVSNLLRRLTASRTFSTGDDDSQVIAQSLLRLLQCAAGDRCNARRVPVKTQHATKCLKPPWIRQTTEHLDGPKLIHD